MFSYLLQVDHHSLLPSSRDLVGEPGPSMNEWWENGAAVRFFVEVFSDGTEEMFA